MVCKNLNIKQRTVISERQETEKMSPTTVAVTALREFSGHDAGGGTQVEPSRLPELRRSQESRDTKAAKVYRT